MTAPPNTTVTPALGHAHRWVPAANVAQAPTLLLLHGTGGNEDDLLELGRYVAPEANLLGVRGNVLEHGAPRFFRRLAEGVFDIPDLHRRTKELGDFIEAAATTYGFSPRTLVALGYSNGANIAGSLLLSEPNRLSGAILLRPMVPFVPQVSPDLSGVPVFIAAGRRDPFGSPDETTQLVRLFKAASATVTLEIQETGHNLLRADIDAAKNWLAAVWQTRRDATH